MRAVCLLLACSLAWSVEPPNVVAQAEGAARLDGGTDGDDAQDSDESPRSRSRRLAIDAQQRFQAGETDAAIRLLIEAQRIYPEPRLLYNLARVFDAAGDNQSALDAYSHYVRDSPDATDRAAVELRIEALRRTIAQLDAVPATPEETGPGPWPWIVTTTGAAILAAGAVTGGLATYTHRQAVAATVHADAVPLAGRADRFAVSTNILIGVGAAVASAGLIWIIVRAVRDHDADEPDETDGTQSAATLRVAIAPTGVAIGGTW